MKALFIDPVNRTPVVVLKDMHSSKIVPIWIGETEAFSIATELQGQKFARPLSHDLMKSIMEAVGAKLEKVVINDLRDNVYIATVYIKTAAGEIRELDDRLVLAVTPLVRAAVTHLRERATLGVELVGRLSGMWDVYDGTGPELMRGFFEELAEGRPVPAALANSQRALVNRLRASQQVEPWLHPYFWAVYTAVGDDRTRVIVKGE